MVIITVLITVFKIIFSPVLYLLYEYRTALLDVGAGRLEAGMGEVWLERVVLKPG